VKIQRVSGNQVSVVSDAANDAGGAMRGGGKIRPVLVKNCYECHSTESGKARGGLKVDSRDALQRGGDSGPAVVAKSLEESKLYQALLYHDDGPSTMLRRKCLCGDYISR
jgi:hypothetical protein